MKSKIIKGAALITVILLATTWGFFRHRGRIRLRRRVARSARMGRAPQFSDRFAIMYEFSHLIELMERCRAVREAFHDYQGGRQKVTYAQVNDLIAQLHREKRKFNTYMWEVRARADLDRPITRRQQRALVYYFHAIDKMIDDMHQVRKHFDYS